VATGRRLLSSPGVAWTVAALGLIVAVTVIVIPSGAKHASPTAAPFDGLPQVGALFRGGSDAGTPFCTASVVDAPTGDLIATAAHCLTGPPEGWVFVPMYHDGQDPHGIWSVQAAYLTSAWMKNQSPQDDFAFLTVASQRRDGQERTLESVVGADRLVTGIQPPEWTVVVGYPARAGTSPIICLNQTFPRRGYAAFRCGGFVDGVSGGPWLANYNIQSGRGDIYGVTGGRHQGGCVNFVSFTSAFGADVTALYQQALSGDDPVATSVPSAQSC
jgi:hypothetical protein